MRRIVSALILLAFCIALTSTGVLAAESASQTYSTIPTFVIKAVDRDNLVTIQTDNLRLNDTYNVTMGPMGAKGVGGYFVATVTTTDTGRITKTFTIPPALYGSHKIAIRLQSPYTGYYAYNWFYNSDANLDLIGSPVPGPVQPPPSPPPYSGYPYFYIASVVQGTSVTITPYNFPPNKTFDVRMNWMYTRGVAGAIVETVTTDANGVLSDTTYTIPDFLQGSYKIAIRLQSDASGYYAFNWFYNNTTP